MIHVPDVRATVDWYRSIGFSVVNTNEEDGELNWAVLSFGGGAVMFNAGGPEQRRDVDLYVNADDVDTIYGRLSGGVEVIEGLHNTFYGAREFIVRDLNGFWVTFGQDIADENAVEQSA
jgi:uncharacterized glyoxalase superfamily protein PhnB